MSEAMQKAEAAFLARCDSEDPYEWMARMSGAAPFETHRFTGSYIGVPTFEVLDTPRNAPNPS